MNDMAMVDLLIDVSSDGQQLTMLFGMELFPSLLGYISKNDAHCLKNSTVPKRWSLETVCINMRQRMKMYGREAVK